MTGALLECMHLQLGVPEWVRAAMVIKGDSGQIDLTGYTLMWRDGGDSASPSYFLIFDSAVGGGTLDGE